uniref:Uncharacterized protein n=1 Tax=Oryza punctata TaxID=4537 RepID=A0A0E0LQB7_ORYPU
MPAATSFTSVLLHGARAGPAGRASTSRGHLKQARGRSEAAAKGACTAATYAVHGSHGDDMNRRRRTRTDET